MYLNSSTRITIEVLGKSLDLNLIKILICGLRYSSKERPNLWHLFSFSKSRQSNLIAMSGWKLVDSEICITYLSLVFDNFSL